MHLEYIPFEIYLIWFGIVGAAAGSFFHVCVWRIPRGISTVTPASHCPACDTHLAWYDNLPMISYLLSLAKCRYCGVHIPVRYFMYELVTACSFMGIYTIYGLTFTTFVYIAFTSILIIGSGIDLDYFFIPDFLSLPLIPLAIITAMIAQMTDRLPNLLVDHTGDALIGILVGGGIVAIVRKVGELVFRQEAMGFGDVKHLAGLGGFLGWEYVLVCFFLASFYGSIVGVPMKLFCTSEKYQQLPFVPYLSLGAYSCLIFGKPLLDWYLGPFYAGY